MQRRQFLSLTGAFFCALPVHAEQEKVWRIGYLHPGFLTNPADVALINAFKEQLRELGYVEDRNFIMIYRAAEGNNGRLAPLAEQLVALKPDVIVAVATPAIAAAQAATRTIPIVMSPATDPVGSGFVKSLAHPAGNITGMANMFIDLTSKSIELVRTMLPQARKIVVLMSSNPTHPPIYEEVRATAEKAGVVTTPIMARTADDLQRAFKDIAAAESEAVFVLADPLRPAIVTYAASAGIPALYQYSEWVDLGGLVSYGPNIPAFFRRSALYVDKIIRGSDPANLPVEQPTTFELALNLKTARSLNLSIPDSILSRTDRIVE